MSYKKFSIGDTVYDNLGNVYQYISFSPAGNGHICLPWLESRNHDGEPNDWTGDPVTIREVYSDAEKPAQKTAEKMEELTKKCDMARLELTNIINERKVLDTEIRARSERIKQHEKLRLLDEYIEGKITHFVVAAEYSESISVKTVEDALKHNDKYARGIKLLTLYGDSKGDLQFRINHYSDGSGGSFSGDAYPFTSEGEAKAFAKELVGKRLTECISGKHGMNGAGIPSGLDGWIKTADEHDVPVPTEWREKIKAYRIECLNKYISDLQQKIDDASKEIAKVKGGAA